MIMIMITVMVMATTTIGAKITNTNATSETIETRQLARRRHDLRWAIASADQAPVFAPRAPRLVSARRSECAYPKFGSFRADSAAGTSRLKELLPAAKRIALLVNPAVATTAEPTVRGVEAAGQALGLDIEVFNASTGTEIDAAFAAASSKARPDALLVGSDPLFNTARVQLVALTARYAFPAIYFQRDFVEAGGLMSYGPDYSDSYRQAGLYVGRILKGAKPAELPVQQSTKLELGINIKTAEALGTEVPSNLLVRADETIE